MMGAQTEHKKWVEGGSQERMGGRGCKLRKELKYGENEEKSKASENLITEKINKEASKCLFFSETSSHGNI